jgi:O-antigen ligase
MIITGYFIHDEIVSLVVDLSDNTGWRLMVWVNNIKYTINDTFLIGHGFGTTYFPSRNTVEFMPDPGGDDFLRGQHSSLVNIFYRMGIVGLLLFLAYFKSMEKKIKNFNAPPQLNYILLFGMIIIGVNVGLESPGYATNFVFLIGLVQYIIFEYYKTYRISEYATWHEKGEKKIEQRQ